MFFKVDNKIKVLMVVNLYYPIKHVIFLHNSRLVVQSSPPKLFIFLDSSIEKKAIEQQHELGIHYLRLDN